MFSLMQLFQHMYMASALFNYYGNRVPDYVSNAYFNNSDTLYNTIAYTSIPTSNPSSSPKQTAYGELGYGGIEGLNNQSSYNLSFTIVLPSIDWVTDTYAFGTDFDYVFCLKYIEDDYFQLSGSQTLYDCEFVTDNYWLEPIYQDYFERSDNNVFKIGYDQSTMEWTFSTGFTNFRDINTTDYPIYTKMSWWSPDTPIINEYYQSYNELINGSINNVRIDATADTILRITFYYKGYDAETGFFSYEEFENGRSVGFQEGYTQGVQAASGNLFTLFGYVVDTPILYLRKLFDYEILGVNLFGFMCGVISLAVVLWVVRRLI